MNIIHWRPRIAVATVEEDITSLQFIVCNQFVEMINDLKAMRMNHVCMKT